MSDGVHNIREYLTHSFMKHRKKSLLVTHCLTPQAVQLIVAAHPQQLCYVKLSTGSSVLHCTASQLRLTFAHAHGDESANLLTPRKTLHTELVTPEYETQQASIHRYVIQSHQLKTQQSRCMIRLRTRPKRQSGTADENSSPTGIVRITSSS